MADMNKDQTELLDDEEDNPEGEVGAGEPGPEDSSDNQDQDETDEQPDDAAGAAAEKEAESEPVESPESAKMDRLEAQLGQLTQSVQQMLQRQANEQGKPAPKPEPAPKWDEMTPEELAVTLNRNADGLAYNYALESQKWAWKQLQLMGNLVATVAGNHPQYKDAVAAINIIHQNPNMNWDRALKAARADRLESENQVLRKQQDKSQRHIEKRREQAKQRQKPQAHPPTVKSKVPLDLDKNQRFQLFQQTLREQGINPGP